MWGAAARLPEVLVVVEFEVVVGIRGGLGSGLG